VGDDFVRDGIKYLLKCYFKDKRILYQYVHKHTPVTVRKGFEKVRSLKVSERVEKYIPKLLTPDKIRNADIIIQSGAPLYWFHSEKNASYKNEWFTPLIEERFKKARKKKILLNIGVGSCQQYHSDGREFFSSPHFIEFVTNFYNLCNLTTVRDELSFQLLSKLKLSTFKLPCPSIFSSDFNGIDRQKGEYLVLNYMPMGGHYDFGKDIDISRWEKTFESFYDRIKANEKIVFACHDEKEVLAARSLFPDAELFFSKNYVDYVALYSNAKFGIVNRVHAGFQLASNLKPSMIIGSDSRAKMAKEIGIESFFVNEVDVDLLLLKYRQLNELVKSDDFELDFKRFKDLSRTKYLNQFDEVFNVK
jgi:hypothetical protein